MQQPQNAPNPGVIEVVVSRYEAKIGQPIAPQPPRFETDNSSGTWGMQECKWTGGCVVIVWARLTRSPLIVMPPRDQPPPLPPPAPDALPPAYVDSVGPAPVPPPAGHNVPPITGEEMDRQLLGRIAQSNVHEGPPVASVPQVPNLAPPPPQALPYHYHLPHYARQRSPLATQQNVSVRGGAVAAVVPTAPPYVAPSPPQQGQIGSYTVAGSGLLAAAEVRPCSAPLPPSPLDFAPPAPASSGPELGAVPVTQLSIAPAQPIGAPPPQAPKAANVAVTNVHPTDLSAHATTPRTEPARLSSPPAFANISPPDRSLQPLPPPPERIAPHVEQPDTAAP